MDRGEATRRFFELLEQLEVRMGGSRCVGSLTGRMQWPERGVCFFFEPGERRSGSGTGLRVVHVGTHAVSGGSKSKLWNRVRQHRGTINPPSPHWLGNHSPSERVRCSGPWNRNNVDDSVDLRFLGVLDDLIRGADSFWK